VRLGVGIAGVYGGKAAPPVRQLLLQRHVLAALRTLGQVLLCFADPQLLTTLAALPIDTGGSGLPALPLVAGCGDNLRLRPELVLAFSAAWAALLSAAATSLELKPLVAAVSLQLESAPGWALPRTGPRRLPSFEEPSAAHKAFALQVLQELAEQQRRQQQPQPHAGQPLSLLFAGPSRFDALAAGPMALRADARAPSPLAAAAFAGSEWQRPVRGGEVELFLQFAYWLACLIDWVLGREAKVVAHGQVPQTEWPRMFANWKFSASGALALGLAVLW